MKRLLILLLTLLIILNTGIAFGADVTNPDYRKGYEAGLSYGQANFGKDTSASEAFGEHISKDNPSFDSYNNYRDGFYQGYDDGLKGVTQSLNYPEVLGNLLGSIYGSRDFQDGRKSNWEKALPSDKAIIRMFDLNLETESYRAQFLSIFNAKFAESYLIAYEKALLEPVRITLQDGVKDGEEIGGLLGATFGNKDYYSGRHSEFSRNIPSDREIIAEYSLNSDKDEYKEGFLSGFKRAFETEYNKTFREAIKNETMRDEKDAFNHGKEAGIVKGELAATNDYLQYLNNNWRRALPSEDEITNEYNLRLQSENYRNGFIGGFFDGYSEGYNNKFKEFSQGSSMNKTNSALVPIKGGFLNSLDNAFALNIKEGTYYHPVNLSIDTVYNNNLYSSNIFIKASDNYTVRLLNTSNNFDDNKLIEVAFEYHGDRLKGGIYRYIDNRWMYLPSKIEDGYISTTIRPSSLTTPATFSVFLDSNVGVLTDSRSHWAKDEINAFVRRGFITGYGDGTFKPERGITRGEFLYILSRVYNWNLSYYYGGATKFKDLSGQSVLNNIVNYSTAYGYIQGYPDNTFKPNNPITYREAEIIMRRVENNYNFKWQDVANKMLHERKVKSPSFTNIKGNITRAEVVYMLYNFNANKY